MVIQRTVRGRKHTEAPVSCRICCRIFHTEAGRKITQHEACNEDFMAAVTGARVLAGRDVLDGAAEATSLPRSRPIMPHRAQAPRSYLPGLRAQDGIRQGRLSTG